MAVIALLDTNIVLYLLGGKLAEPLSESDYLVSVITEIELLSYPNLNEQAEKQIRAFLAHITIIDLDTEIKNLAIQLRREHRLKLPDALIAATSLVMGASLITNDSHLCNIPNLTCKQVKIL